MAGATPVTTLHLKLGDQTACGLGKPLPRDTAWASPENFRELTTDPEIIVNVCEACQAEYAQDHA